MKKAAKIDLNHPKYSAIPDSVKDGLSDIMSRYNLPIETWDGILTHVSIMPTLLWQFRYIDDQREIFKAKEKDDRARLSDISTLNDLVDYSREKKKEIKIKIEYGPNKYKLVSDLVKELLLRYITENHNKLILELKQGLTSNSGKSKVGTPDKFLVEGLTNVICILNNLIVNQDYNYKIPTKCPGAKICRLISEIVNITMAYANVSLTEANTTQLFKRLLKENKSGQNPD